jgi:DNA-binding transcriptional regulator YiaG
MSAPVEGWVRTVSREPVHIPTTDGHGIAETLWVDVPAWKDPQTEQIFLDGEAAEKLENVKARHLGLLTPAQMRDLRNALDLTQKDIAGLLQLGEKSWTRWESGRERPSRSMNVLLCALYDGRIDVNYLQTLADPAMRSQFNRWKPMVNTETPSYGDCNRCNQRYAHASESFAA